MTEGNARRSSLDSALADRFALYPTLAAIARVLPSDVWLTSLNLTSPTPADTPPPAPVAATSGTTTTTTDHHDDHHDPQLLSRPRST